MLKYSHFKYPHQFFHLNFELNIFPQFKSLDWAFLCHNLNLCIAKWSSLEIHAVVMMDTHVHILLRISDQNENFFTDELLKLLGQKSPAEILIEPIKNYSQYLNTYKYIYRNPVDAHISLMCESYPYSSLHTLLGQSSVDLKVIDALGLIQNPRKILSWVNSNNDYKVSKLKDLRQDIGSPSFH